ncbi:MAG: DUF1844 domain-containing protein [Armatimonadota bacterium]
MEKDNEEQQEQKTYEVKDKRRVNPDGTLKENVETKEPESCGCSSEHDFSSTCEKEYEDDTKDEMPPPNVYAVLQFVIGLLADQAWQLMGIRLAPGQKEVIKDLKQAKIAIDTIAFIADQLSSTLKSEEKTLIQAMLSDLQINYVNQSK